MSTGNTRYNYAREKLLNAIEILATRPGDVRSRLFIAYNSIHSLREKHFPSELKQDWNWIDESLTKFAPIYTHNGNEVRVGSVENTLSRIQNRTGSKIADRLFHLYRKLHFKNDAS